MPRTILSHEVCPLFKLIDFLAAGNLLKALGPNDELSKATKELDRLLKMETSIIVTKINKTTSDTHVIAKKSYITGVQINERTAQTQKIITQQAATMSALADHTVEVQKTLKETTTLVAQFNRKHSVAMDRVEGISASSQASIEELKERLNTLTGLVSGVNGSPFHSALTYLDTRDVHDDLAELRCWLEPVEYSEEDYLRNLNLRSPDTCDWAFTNSDPLGKSILEWLDGRNKEHAVVWLTGNPAQGKSVFAAYLIKKCKEKYGDCMYFFCRQDNEEKRSMKKVLQTIAFRLAEIEDAVRLNYMGLKKQGISLADMPSAMLWEKLFKEPSGLSKTTHCVIDGFDELRRSDRREFASLLSNTAFTNIRILVVSRPDREIEDAFGESHIHIVRINKKRTNKDIRKVVAARVQSKLRALSIESQRKVVDTLTKKAGGLFLWAKLALDIICRKRLETAIVKALDDLPLGSEMQGLYTVIVKRISAECEDDDDKELAKALLTWTFCSFRPLSVDELQFAVEMKFGPMTEFEKIVRDFSGSLIEIEERHVAVVHATVKDFFMSEEAGEFRISEEMGNKLIASICLDYLNGAIGHLPTHFHAMEDSVPQPDQLRLQYPFLEYAAKYLFSHIQTFQPSTSFISNLFTFLEGRRSLTWMEALGTFDLVHVLSLAANTIEKFGDNEMSRNVANDLSRIAMQIEENVTKYPRSVHVSLSSTFPEACFVARRGRYDFAKCLQPNLSNWPASKAFRAAGHSAWETKVAMSFSSCGEYLVFGQMPVNNIPVTVKIYQTQTYLPVIKLDPFIYQNEGNETVFPLRDPYLFFQIRCGSISNFRVLLAFATGRAFVSGGEIYSKCVLAEQTSESPYQAGAWREISLNFPVSRTSPQLGIALNPNGQQIVAWNIRTFFFWRHASARILTFGLHASIVAAEFVIIEGSTVVLCLLSQSLRIYDGQGRHLSDISYDFGPIANVVVDPLAAKILVYPPRKNEFSTVQVEFKFKRYFLSAIDQTNDVQRYSGSLGTDKWNYVVWESNGHRYLVQTETTPQTVYPHPVKKESIISSLQDHGFVVFDDSLPPKPHPDLVNQNIVTPEVAFWQAVVWKDKDESNRIWIHNHNYKISPCSTYIAFMGCDGLRHEKGCEKCLSDPTRLGIGDRSTDTPFVRWPVYEEFAEGRTEISFDRYGRLFIFTDRGNSCVVHIVNLINDVKLQYVGLLPFHDITIPPALHAMSRHKTYFACYSSRGPLEIWMLDMGDRQPILRHHKTFEDTRVISAHMQSSTLVFISESNWLGTLQVDGEDVEIRKHFWLPSWQLFIPKGGGRDRCKLSCTEDGVVTLLDIYGKQWQFRVDSVGQLLQSISYY